MSSSAAPAPDIETAAQAIRQCAQSFVEADEFAGVVALESQGRLVLAQAYGPADPAKKLSNRFETPFNIASVGKIFTATAVGQLIDKGKLNLGDPAGRYLPELPPVLARVTIAQLLNHSSGVGEIIKENRERIAAAKTARELVGLIAQQPTAFEPGAQHRYSNSGPIILGGIIEAISGKTYDAYVRDHIFQPAGMVTSTIKSVAPGAALMLTRSEVLTGEMHITSGVELPRRPGRWKAGGGPFGAGYSSAPDLLNFARAMRSGRLLSERTKSALWAGGMTVPGAGPGRYAHGFQTSEEGGTLTVGHSGLAGGANAEFHWAPKADWALVVLSNYDPMAATMIGNAARLVLTGQETPTSACDAARRGRGMPMPMGAGPGPVPGGSAQATR